MASPIEDRFRAALLCIEGPLQGQAGWMLDCTRRHRELRNGNIEPSSWLDDDRHERTVYVYSGVTVLSYRVDFMLEFGARRLAIECDGHDFHDRTKQQAAYDRARDRELLRIGIPTIRFTGSEIVHSPERCADEACRCLLALPDARRVRRVFHDGWEEARTWCISYYEGQHGVEEHW